MPDAPSQLTLNSPELRAPSVVRVLLPMPPGGPYDYAVPEPHTVPARGSIVRVPLGPREVTGVVWGLGEGEVEPARLKPLLEVLPVPALPEPLCRFVDWVAGYTLAPASGVLALALRSRAALEPPPVRMVLEPTGHPPDRLTAPRAKVLEAAEAGPAPARALAAAAGVSEAVVRGLLKSGALAQRPVPGEAPFTAPRGARAGHPLTAEQAAAAQVLRAGVAEARFSVTLIDGVTGSGKTEVYFEAMAEAFARGRQVLLLVPEIALTAQFLSRFEEAFGCRPAEWHSDLGQAERRRVWRGVIEGRVKAVVGARSALFLPFQDLGLIVIDEEHEQAFKQEDGVVYHGRDMGVVRAQIENAPVLLVSATPALETVANVERGKYARVALPSRPGAARLPAIEAVDLREDPPERDHWLSPTLVAAMEETLAAGEQTLLFLNRRGYAPLTLCRVCGHRLTAPDTSSWLVEHRLTGRLVCHHSGYSIPKPKTCPECGAEDSLAPCGPGVERVAEEVAERFPDARRAIMSSDTVLGPKQARELVDAMAEGALDILIGTQMVAKGHNFPGLTLVGVVDADLGLAGGDLRAGERTYQVLHQVAGRAGRAQKPGRVLLQTYDPGHKVMAALLSGDRDRFLKAEAEDREVLGLPPFGRLAALILSSPDEERLQAAARALARAAPREAGLAVWGPAPAPFALLRGRHRIRFLIKGSLDHPLQGLVRAWLGRVKLPPGVRLQVDIDPYSFL